MENHLKMSGMLDRWHKEKECKGHPDESIKEEDKNVLEFAVDKTKEVASKAGRKTKEAASNIKETVSDFVTGDERSESQKAWDEAKDHLTKGAEKAQECNAQQIHDIIISGERRKQWNEAKEDMNQAVEKSKTCGDQQARDARGYIEQKLHEASRNIESH